MGEKINYTPPEAVEDIDLARKMAEAEVPSRQDAAAIRRGGSGYESEKATQQREERAQQRDKIATQLAEDVEMGEEGIKKEVEGLKAEIANLSGLHMVSVTGHTPGVIMALHTELGVDVNHAVLKTQKPTMTRDGVAGSIDISIYPTNVPEKYCIISFRDNEMSERYFNMRNPSEDIKGVAL